MSQLYTQPDLFLQDRIPHKPYCKDFKDAPQLVRSYAYAIKRRYIQVNQHKKGKIILGAYDD